MIKTNAMIMEELGEYASPKTKLSRMVNNGEYYRITKGLYETDRTVPARFLAGSIYGPSYISFEYALSYHGMIPETAYTITCATYEKKKKKRFDTPFGLFTYRDVPASVFNMHLLLNNEGEYWYRIASPEKALCDRLYIAAPVKNNREMYSLLFEDLRIDEYGFANMDIQAVFELAERYHSMNVKRLYSVLRRMK